MATNAKVKPTFGSAVEAIYLTIIHTCMALMKLAMGGEEIVDLARNEVENLNELQMIRLDSTKAERKALRAVVAA